MRDKQNEPDPKPRRKLFYIVRDSSHKSRRPLLPNSTVNNIFDLNDSQMELYRFSETDTPVGGWKLFQNIRKKIEQPLVQPKQISSVELNQRKTPLERNRRRVNFQENGRPTTVNGNYVEECLKANGKWNPQSTSNSFLARKRSSKKQNEFFKREQNSYHKKMGILGELDYRAPIQVKMGTRYFELALRDRIQEEKMVKPYMYQISEGEEDMTCHGKACFQKALNKIRSVLNSPKPQYMQARGVNKKIWQDA